MTKDLVPAVLTFGRKVFFLAKNAFFPKKHPKFAKRLIFILEKGTFLFAQLFPVVARTRCPDRSGFFQPEISVFWPKNPIFATRPQILTTARLQPSERWFISNLRNNFSTCGQLVLKRIKTKKRNQILPKKGEK